MLITQCQAPTPLYVAGARCVFTSGMAPVVDGMCMLHALTSFQGAFSLSVTADRDMLPDSGVNAAGIDEAFSDLREAAWPDDGPRERRGGGAMRRHRGFLVTSALAAAGTAYAYGPRAPYGYGSLASWLASWGVSELPGQFLGAQLAGAGLALTRGAAGTPAGRAGLALTGASAAGLLGLRRRAIGAGAVLEAALVEGLGPDYRRRIVQPRPPALGAAVAQRPGLYRLMRIRSLYAHDTDLAYGEAGPANLLDIWRRPDLPAEAGAPVLLQIPGGSWTMGNKQGQGYPLMSHLAEHGWVCVSMAYRVSPRATWPDHVIDVKRAIAWIRSNIARYGGNPDFVAVTGGSAGGHLSALAAVTPNAPEFQPGFEDADTRVQAAVPLYGVYDLTDEHGRPDTLAHWEKTVLKRPIGDSRALFESASPLHRIGNDAPPFFLLHGTHDVLLRVEQARLMAERLRLRSAAPVVFAELPGATHAFDVIGAPRAIAAAESIGRFLGVTYGDWLRERGMAEPIG
jgi:acetyl esterase/lipase